MSDIDDDNSVSGGILSLSDAAEIGFKIVEMADRLLDVDAAMPGSQATFTFDLDDREFLITITRVKK